MSRALTQPVCCHNPRMSLLQHAPRLAVADAVRLAREMYALDASASTLPSERDQNFLLTSAAAVRYVLKVANAFESRAMLDAQNAAMTHVAGRVGFCPRILPTIAGDMIGIAPGGIHLVRLVTHLAGIPLAELDTRPPALFESLGRAVGRLDSALADFDHPALHRDFHWDLVHASRVIREHLPLIQDDRERQLVERVTGAALQAIAGRHARFRRTAVHHDANDWNVLVDGDRVVGIIDFGDMVHSWTVADPAVAVAYAMLDRPDPLETAAAVTRGYHAQHPLGNDELAAVFPLACLRLCMSACIAAWQQRQRADDEYLAVSQAPIRRTLPALAAIGARTAEDALRRACALGPRA
jgi:Ser/Thr protein kinase RdoA (MazF antagonist)